MSSGTFKPSSLASYERGDRTLSVERFVLLADLYGIRPARLMAQISQRVEGRPPIVVAIGTAQAIGGVEGAVLAGFVQEVVALRRQPAPEVISLRDGDFEVLATAAGRRVEEFMQAVEPALRQPPARRSSSPRERDRLAQPILEMSPGPPTQHFGGECNVERAPAQVAGPG